MVPGTIAPIAPSQEFVMGRLLQIVGLVCLVLLPVACMNSDALPQAFDFLPALAQEPRQNEVVQPPIDVAVGGVEYRVEPQFKYALDGMVVSYKVHDADHLLHHIWNDHLNVADMCVVWGTNAGGVDLNAFDFANGEFTCTYRTHDETAWRAFRQDQISNNHLITADTALRQRIDDIAVGDQVRVEGYLANYSNQDGFHRGTSTTRKDTGNGACETVYVTSFDIVSPAPRGWRTLQNVALWGFGLCASLWLLGIARGWF
jgi:major membrane immunogen (membrane-anchored lipoprotein)